jgi:hypothetical protein
LLKIEQVNSRTSEQLNFHNRLFVWQDGHKIMIQPEVNPTTKLNPDEQYMRIAIDYAKIAEENGDEPT